MPKNGKVSEEMFKNEAITFFKLSAEQSTKSKAEFKRQIEKFVTTHKNMERGLNMVLGHENPLLVVNHVEKGQTSQKL